VIVQTRAHCHALAELGRRTGLGKGVYHWASGKPIRTVFFERAMRELAFFLASDGVA